MPRRYPSSMFDIVLTLTRAWTLFRSSIAINVVATSSYNQQMNWCSVTCQWDFSRGRLRACSSKWRLRVSKSRGCTALVWNSGVFERRCSRRVHTRFERAPHCKNVHCTCVVLALYFLPRVPLQSKEPGVANVHTDGYFTRIRSNSTIAAAPHINRLIGCAVQPAALHSPV